MMQRTDDEKRRRNKLIFEKSCLEEEKTVSRSPQRRKEIKERIKELDKLIDA